MKEVCGRVSFGLVAGLLVQAAVEMGIAASRKPVPLPVKPAAAQGVSVQPSTTNRALDAKCGVQGCNQQPQPAIKK